MIQGPMTREACMRLLEEATFGRLGVICEGTTRTKDAPAVRPYNFYWDMEEQKIYAHCLEGETLTAMRQHPVVCLQVDAIEDTYHWRSVVVTGRFEEVTDNLKREQVLAEIFRRIPQLTPVESRMNKGTGQCIVFTINPDKITGMEESW